MSDRTNTPVSTQVSELKVSAHTMSLEPGVFCVFTAPGSPVPDGGSGLPAVKIAAAPGSRGGVVSLSGLDPAGWVGPDGATLVRVTGGAGELLVTVYQAKDSAGDAPQIQVVHISQGHEAAPGRAPVRGKPVAAEPQAAARGAAEGAGRGAGQAAASGAARDEVQVMGHVYARGDVGARLGDWVGEPGSKRWVEGFGVGAAPGVQPGDIEYQAVLGRGWLSPWSEGGQFCGSRGMSLPILGLRVRLRGEAAKTHQVQLEGTFIDGETVGPVSDGQACEATSLAALEAFRLNIMPKDEAVARRAGPAKAKAAPEPVGKAAANARPAPAARPVVAKAVAQGPAAARPAKKSALPSAPKPVTPKPSAAKPVAAKPVAPKTVTPKTPAPKTAAPKTAAPKTVAPKTVAPTIAAKPVGPGPVAAAKPKGAKPATGKRGPAARRG